MSKINSKNVSNVNDYIVKWLQEYAQKATAKGFVIGVSGGIDSAVTSTLCAQTSLPTLCVTMPIHQAQSHVARAYEHIENLKQKYPNVSHLEADLTAVFETFKNQVPQDVATAKLQLSLANTRSRLRMTTLYCFAGIHNYLVAGTGNKVEDFGVGFYTKYGDGGVDLSPIADLMKSDVYELGRFFNVPQSIIVAAPTDGLFGDDRSDEDQIGASYDELEWAMLADEAGKTATDFSEREKEVFIRYKQMNANNQHKMNPIPVCIIPQNL
jgi:NAD+ synthase